MAKIAVFDSGLGSLSIIKAIQKISKSEIIYFADQKNYPYGKKSQAQLSNIIKNTQIIRRKIFSRHHSYCIKYTQSNAKCHNRENF